MGGGLRVPGHGEPHCQGLGLQQLCGQAACNKDQVKEVDIFNTNNAGQHVISAGTGQFLPPASAQHIHVQWVQMGQSTVQHAKSAGGK